MLFLFYKSIVRLFHKEERGENKQVLKEFLPTICGSLYYQLNTLHSVYQPGQLAIHTIDTYQYFLFQPGGIYILLESCWCHVRLHELLFQDIQLQILIQMYYESIAVYQKKNNHKLQHDNKKCVHYVSNSILSQPVQAG